MSRVPRTAIDATEAAYIELLILDQDPENKKLGMQMLCALYRQNRVLRNPTKIATFAIGLLHDESPKVRRWALNTLANIGTKREVPAIIEAVERNQSDPHIVGSGIASLAAILPPDDLRTHLRTAELPLEGATLLAVAQQNTAFLPDILNTHLDIQKASSAELRFATLLIGLDRAPKHLLSPTLSYNKVIGELNRYPDSIVAQYSVWATVENSKLSLKDLGLPLKDIESYPPNVRKYVYRLITGGVTVAQDNLEYLHAGSLDDSEEARDGLASGMRDLYFDSIERLTLDWFADEESEIVRQRLLEHMAANERHFAGYRTPVIRSYEHSKANGLARARLEAAARGTDLFVELKRIGLQTAQEDLFGDTLGTPRARLSCCRFRRRHPKLALPAPRTQLG